MDRQPLTLRNDVRRSPSYRGGERNEHSNIGETRNVTEREPNIRNAFERVKLQRDEARRKLAEAEAIIEKRDKQLDEARVLIEYFESRELGRLKDEYEKAK